jgi:hypothetical protein
MINIVPGWNLDQYKLLIQVLGIALLALILVYVALSSRGSQD